MYVYNYNMCSMFWENFEAKRKELLKIHKEITFACKLSDCFISNGKKRKSSPPVNKAYLLAKSVNTTIEELAAGREGLDYVLNSVKERHGLIQVPAKRLALIERLLLLDKNEFAGLIDYLDKVQKTNIQ